MTTIDELRAQEALPSRMSNDRQTGDVKRNKKKLGRCPTAVVPAHRTRTECGR